MVLGERDFKIMRLLFENKIVSRKQIGSRFFPNVSKDTVNRRLRKIAPTLPYKVKTKATRSECPLHDIALNDIRKAFEAKASVQGYYTENVLQTRIDFKDDKWFQPFIKLNSDAMAEVDTRIGVLNLAI